MAENLPINRRYLTSGLEAEFGTVVDQMIKDMGRSVVLYLPPTASGCPNCKPGFDGSSNGIYNASNPFSSTKYNKNFPAGGICPICKGTQNILTAVSVTYTANINHAPKDSDREAPGIDPANVFKTKMQLCAFHDILSCEKALIDGNICKRIRDPIKRGLGTTKWAMTWWEKID
jgi:hypothetical protein